MKTPEQWAAEADPDEAEWCGPAFQGGVHPENFRREVARIVALAQAECLETMAMMIQAARDTTMSEEGCKEDFPEHAHNIAAYITRELEGIVALRAKGLL